MGLNASSYFRETDDTFKQFLIVSVVLHFSFVLVTVVKSFLLPGTPLIIENAVRVDMVALPDKVEEVAPAPPAPESAKPVVTAPKKDTLKDAKETQKKALEKLKALEAIEKLKKEVNQEPARPTQSTAATPKPFKGNIISSGNSFTGMSRIRVNEYYSNLTAKIREHWVLPQWLNNPNLKASVIIELDSRGYVIRKEIYTSSGNTVFDASCLSAVNDASPFTSPPDEVIGELLMIRFPLG